MKYTAFMAMAALVLTTGCSTKQSENDNILVEVGDIPVSQELKCESGEVLPVESMGIYEIKTVDSLIIVSNGSEKGFWEIYSMPDIKLISKRFDVGGGPQEFPTQVPAIQATFYHNESGDIVADIPTLVTPVIRTENLSSQTDTVSQLVLQTPCDKVPTWTRRVQGRGYLQHTFSPDSLKATRSLYSFDGVKLRDIKTCEIPGFKLADNNELPLLLGIPVIRPDGDMMAEFNAFQGIIYLYDFKEDKYKTISYSDINTGEDKVRERFRDDKPVLVSGMAFDNFFAIQRVNYISETEKNYNIDFFDWNGKVLATIPLSCENIRGFDIDLKTGDLYCLDVNEDNIVRFNISETLSKLKRD